MNNILIINTVILLSVTYAEHVSAKSSEFLTATEITWSGVVPKSKMLIQKKIELPNSVEEAALHINALRKKGFAIEFKQHSSSHSDYWIVTPLL